MSSFFDGLLLEIFLELKKEIHTTYKVFSIVSTHPAFAKKERDKAYSDTKQLNKPKCKTLKTIICKFFFRIRADYFARLPLSALCFFNNVKHVKTIANLFIVLADQCSTMMVVSVVVGVKTFVHILI